MCAMNRFSRAMNRFSRAMNRAATMKHAALVEISGSMGNLLLKNCSAGRPQGSRSPQQTAGLMRQRRQTPPKRKQRAAG